MFKFIIGKYFQFNYLLLLLFVFSPDTFSNNSEQWITQEINIEHGLPDPTVFSIQQDKSGFMWFGTTNGLARFDGYSFKVFRHDGADVNTISNNNAGNIFIDSKNKLWIGTFGGGVNTLDLNSGELIRYPYSSNKNSNIISENVQSFYEDNNNNTWIGTSNGLYQINGNDLIHYNHRQDDPNSLIHPRVWNISGNKNGDLWVGTSEGLSHLNPKTGKIINYKLPIELTIDISSNQFRKLFFLNDRLWIGSSTGLYSFNPQTKIFSNHSTNRPMKINDIKLINNDQLFIASMEGLYQFDISNNQFHQDNNGNYWQAYKHLDIRNLFIDISGLLWLATRDNGVIKIDQKGGLFKYHNILKVDNQQAHKNAQLWSLEFNSQEQLFVGSSENLFKISKKNVVEKITTPANQSVPGIIRDTKLSKNKGTWIGSSEGLFFIDEKSLIVKEITAPFDLAGIKPTDVFSIEETHNNELWLALYNIGVLRWQIDSEKATLIQSYTGGLLTDANISHIYQDSNNDIWIGSNLIGAFRFDSKTEELQHYLHDFSDSKSLSSNRIKDIFQDSKNRLWFATFRGLNLYNFEDNSFTHYMKSDGLLDNTINAILEDSKQNIWIIYTFGISRFIPENSEISSFILNSSIRNDGLNTRSATIDNNDILYLGSAAGYFTFNPIDIIKTNTFQPTLEVTDVIINNKPRTFSELLQNNSEFKLYPNDKKISFRFASLDYKISEQINYKYKIQGLLEDWLDVTPTRQIELNKLNPGKYTIEIQANNNDGRWTEHSLNLKLNVHPNWWNIGWVRILLIIVGAFIAISLHHYRTYKIKRQNEILETKVEKRTEELVDLNTKLKLASQTDFLTGIYNRSGFLKNFKKKDSTSYTIVVTDVDNFKKINDIYGHSAGDSILQNITKIMKNHLSENDLLARWGGEEFIFYLRIKDKNKAFETIEKIRLEIQNANFSYKDNFIPVTCTFGICCTLGDMELKACINAADEAMYKGKNKGRNMTIISNET